MNIMIMRVTVFKPQAARLVYIHHCKSSLSFPARLACPARKAVTAYNLLYIL